MNEMFSILQLKTISLSKDESDKNFLWGFQTPQPMPSKIISYTLLYYCYIAFDSGTWDISTTVENN